MKKEMLLYEGKAKKLFSTDKNQVLWVEYLDQATALNGQRKDSILNKGQLNNQITAKIFDYLRKESIPNHFVEEISKTEQLVEKVEMLPLEIVVRNVAAESFSNRVGVSKGQKLSFPVIEFYYKNDALNDPFINDNHIRLLGIANEEEIEEMKQIALNVNEKLIDLFRQINIRLIDFKIEIGRRDDRSLILADEISPDTCRLWDVETNEHLDKDVYRKNLGDLVSVYQEVLDRLNQIKDK